MGFLETEQSTSQQKKLSRWPDTLLEMGFPSFAKAKTSHLVHK